MTYKNCCSSTTGVVFFFFGMTYKINYSLHAREKRNNPYAILRSNGIVLSKKDNAATRGSPCTKPPTSLINT